MGQRDDKHHHANRRRRLEKDSTSRGQKNDEIERAPLAGYETLYEISRTGRVFSLKTRAVLVGGYHHSPFIRITVNGTVVTLAKDRAIAESWKRVDADADPG